MADIDWGDLVKQGLSAASGYVQQQMALKNAKKMARLMQPPGGFSMLGTGNMRFAGGGGVVGYGSGYGAPYATPAAYSPMPVQGGGLGDIFGSLGMGGGVAMGLQELGVPGCPTLWKRPSAGPHVRAISLLHATNPDTGVENYWRNVGPPMIFRGDIAHCRSIERLLSKSARKLGRGYRRPR